MITTALILFYFISGFLLACLTVLLLLSPDRRAKAWYAFFLISAGLWLWCLIAKPAWVGGILLFVLPLLWIAGSIKVSGPLTPEGVPIPPKTNEPRVTQESLRGPTGTKEALKLYFLWTAIALLAFLSLSAIFSQGNLLSFLTG